MRGTARVSAALMLSAGLLQGCVSVDGRIYSEAVSADGVSAITGRFANRAHYRTTGEFLAEDNLAELMDADGKEADTATLELDRSAGLKVVFEKDGFAVFRKFYFFSDGLRITDDGKLEFPSVRGCDGGGGAVGCISRQLTLFVNKSGDLVALRAGTAGGVYGPFPIGIYTHHMSVFARRTEDLGRQPGTTP